MLTDLSRLMGIAIAQGNTEASRKLADLILSLVAPYAEDNHAEH